MEAGGQRLGVRHLPEPYWAEHASRAAGIWAERQAHRDTGSCLPAAGAAQARGTATAAPDPGRSVGQIPLPPPAVGINPATVGITQLSSWFWVTGDTGPVTVTVNLGGYSVTTTATPVAYQWDFGDGTSAASPGAGTETDPSVTHTFHDKGTYVVTLSIEYAGTYSYAGPGGTGTASLGEYEPPGVSTPYVVQEVRSVLTPSGQV